MHATWRRSAAGRGWWQPSAGTSLDLSPLGGSLARSADERRGAACAKEMEESRETTSLLETSMNLAYSLSFVLVAINLLLFS